MPDNKEMITYGTYTGGNTDGKCMRCGAKIYGQPERFLCDICRRCKDD